MRRLVEYRWWVLVGVVLCLAGLAPGLQTALNVDNSLSVWFLEEDPKVEAYQQFQESFGNDEVILVHVREPEGVFTGEALGRMVEATGAFEAVDGVARTYSVVSAERAEKPTSLTPLTDMAEGELEVEVEPLVPRPIPDSEEKLAAIRQQALAHPLVKGRLVDESAEQAMIIVQMSRLENFDKERGRIVGEVRGVAEHHYGGRFEMGGVGVLYTAMNALTRQDFGRFIGVGYLLMFVLLGLAFRSWRLVVAALAVVAGGTLFALGAMGVAGARLNMVTVILPTIIADSPEPRSSL